MSEEREIQQVLARYVRAADARNGAAMATFEPGMYEIVKTFSPAACW